ncbi:hypothetical protein [Rubrivivax rivuli]|uniref:Type IV pilus biogenesis protein PilP n=1 Tax=Rubrivivax rivuli TaxID=1862385 RepID=A0A437RI00_9BURK|nr:hypothetical protein [Rubrivivax rivuli]RVU46371.1 hypothetical protein EOE66_11065 [Rubrivivax rivuli]
MTAPTACAAALMGVALFFAPAAQGRDLATCRAVTDTAARLACYDALPLPGSALATPAPASKVMGDARAPARVAPAASVAAPNFGQERRDEPQALQSSIPGFFEGWGPRTRIRLANGQVWQVVDDSQGVYALTDAKVTVRRALLGGFVLEIEGANKAPRVRRVE